MTINSEDGRFGLDMWPSYDSEAEKQSEFSDDYAELVERAGIIITSGRFNYLELHEWIYTTSEWSVREVFERTQVT
jgi:hypothetical protein